MNVKTGLGIYKKAKPTHHHTQIIVTSEREFRERERERERESILLGFMAEESVAEIVEANPTAQDMDLDTSSDHPKVDNDNDNNNNNNNNDDEAADSSLSTKRPREGEEEKEEPQNEDNDNGDGVVLNKKQKVDEEEKSLEEERLEKLAGGGGEEQEQEQEKEEEEEKSGQASLGPKDFGSSVEMFDYFYKFLHFWPPNLNVNKVIQTFKFLFKFVFGWWESWFFCCFDFNSVVGSFGMIKKKLNWIESFRFFLINFGL